MIELMPGRALTKPATTRFSDGIMLINLRTRRMRSERSTDRLPLAGSNAIPTTKRSKMRHGSRKKPFP